MVPWLHAEGMMKRRTRVGLRPQRFVYAPRFVDRAFMLIMLVGILICQVYQPCCRLTLRGLGIAWSSNISIFSIRASFI